MRSADNLERRQLLRNLASLAVATAPLAAAGAATAVSAGDIRGAARIAGEILSESRLATLAVVVEKNIRQFQMVRDFDIDDLVGPAAVFVPR